MVLVALFIIIIALYYTLPGTRLLSAK